MSELHLSAILRKLRPPCLNPVRVVYGFSRQEPLNYGLTLSVDEGTPLIAPGDGVVDVISLIGGKWRSDLGAVRLTGVRIDHGRGLKTWVHGIGTPTTNYGPITRGQQLGLAGSTQVFFGVEHNGVFQDPTHINPSFTIQDGFLNYGKSSKIRQAPDLVTTIFTDISSIFASGIRYFFPPTPTKVQFNLDFNGQGTKFGPAVAGSDGDLWQPISPMDFWPIPVSPGYYYGFCAGGFTFQGPQGFFLNDYQGAPTKVYFERIMLTAASGISPFFDPMLSSWVGGYSGMSALVNAFAIRNLPAGVYDVYVYTNGGVTADPTTVYFSADDGTPTPQTATPTVVADWVQGGNYLHATLTVQSRGKITILTYGYLAGVQVIRASV